MPDSFFREVNRLLLDDPEIRTVIATREDEGMAIHKRGLPGEYSFGRQWSRTTGISH